MQPFTSHINSSSLQSVELQELKAQVASLTRNNEEKTEETTKVLQQVTTIENEKTELQQQLSTTQQQLAATQQEKDEIKEQLNATKATKRKSETIKQPTKWSKKQPLAQLTAGPDGKPFQHKTQYVIRQVREKVKQINEMLAEDGDTLDDVIKCISVLDPKQTGKCITEILQVC